MYTTWSCGQDFAHIKMFNSLCMISKTLGMSEIFGGCVGVNGTSTLSNVYILLLKKVIYTLILRQI